MRWSHCLLAPQSSNYSIFILDHNIQNKLIFWKILGNFFETLGRVFFNGNFLKTTCLRMYHLMSFSHCLNSSKTWALLTLRKDSSTKNESKTKIVQGIFVYRLLTFLGDENFKKFQGCRCLFFQGCKYLFFVDVNVFFFGDVNVFLLRGCKHLFASGM